MKSALVATVLMAVIHSGSAGTTKLYILQMPDLSDVSFCKTFLINPYLFWSTFSWEAGVLL